MDCTRFVSAELSFGVEHVEYLLQYVFHKHVYSMNVGHIGDVLVFCVGMCAIRMGYIPRHGDNNVLFSIVSIQS